MIYATITLVIVMFFSSCYGRIKQGNLIPIIGTVLALGVFAGLRDISFGTDLLGYQDRFLSYVPFVGYNEIVMDYKQGTMKDFLFYITMKIFSDVGLSYQVFMAAVTGFYIITVSILIFKYSKKPVISFIMFFCLAWLPFSFTGLRQTVAMGICIISLIFLLNDKQSISAIVCIFLAGFVHSSAWIFFIAPIIARLDIRLGKIRFIGVTVASLTLSVLGSTLFRQIIVAIAWNNTMANYADFDISLNWSGFIIQLIIAAVSFIFYDTVINNNPNMSLLYSMMAIGVGFQAFSTVVAEMFRVSMYFSIASICVYPAVIMSIKRKDYRTLAFYLSILLLLIYFFQADKFATYIPIIE